MVTVGEILRLPVLQGARVVAGRKGLRSPVRWCHVSEVLDIARLLSGGELLLTTGLALEVEPERQVAYIEELHRSGVAGLMLELERKFSAAPPPMVAAAERLGLPLITLPFDTHFVQVTEAVHGLVLSQQPVPDGPASDQGAERRFWADLWAGRVSSTDDLKQRLTGLGRSVPTPSWMAVLAVAAAYPQGIRAAAAAELGPHTWLLRTLRAEQQLVAFGSDRSALVAGFRRLALRLAPSVAGAGRCYSDPRSAALSLTEAQFMMRLRRLRPDSPLAFAESGVYQLALQRSQQELQQFVTEWLGPLLQYDRVHRTDLCLTLRLLLDDRLVVAEVAQRLHLTRQGLYHRQQRIAAILGLNLEEGEVRAALAVALRFRDVLDAEAAGS